MIYFCFVIYNNRNALLLVKSDVKKCALISYEMSKWQFVIIVANTFLKGDDNDITVYIRCKLSPELLYL